MKNFKKVTRGEIRNNVSFSDFAKVFKVYESYPFYESWSDEELKQEYDFVNKNNGMIFGYYLDNECVSMVIIYPMIPGEHPVKYPEDKKVMYLSDIATIREYRGHGCASKLFDYALEHTKVLGYDYIYLRTNYDETISMSAGIAKKCGFKRIDGIDQIVTKMRINGTVGDDRRMFMDKKLK